MSNAKLTKSAEKVLKYMKKQQRNGELTANRRELAKNLNLGTATISRAIQQLQEQGYLSKLSGKEECKANTYFLAGNLEEVARMTAKPVEKIIYPLDKLNFHLWQGLESKRWNVGVKKQGSKEEVNVIFEPIFSGKPMNAYDKRVNTSAFALYNAGNEYMTAGQIYRTMGGEGYPNQKKYEKLKQSIEKMAIVRININNEQEAIKYKYPTFQRYGANLLACSYEETIELNSGKSNYCLHMLEIPPLMKYAIVHTQVTTYTPEQFQMPLSMTEMNCAIDDYFRYRIARASGSTVKILLKTLFEYCNISTRNDRYYAKQRFDKFLTFYAEVKLIQDYTIKLDTDEEDYILIRL